MQLDFKFILVSEFTVSVKTYEGEVQKNVSTWTVAANAIVHTYVCTEIPTSITRITITMSTSSDVITVLVLDRTQHDPDYNDVPAKIAKNNMYWMLNTELDRNNTYDTSWGTYWNDDYPLTEVEIKAIISKHKNKPITHAVNALRQFCKPLLRCFKRLK
jgi:hypothetical protein